MYMPYYYGNYYMLDWLIFIIVMVMGLASQAWLNSTFKKYSGVPSKRGVTGAAAARSILDTYGYSTTVRRTSGRLTDHFDPRSDTVNLSDSTFDNHSIAAVGVAAHECGHVIQKKEGYAPMKLRNAIVPVVNIGSQLSFPLMLIGLMMGLMNLAYLGIALYSLAVVFQLVTLPVEFNASSRAVSVLQSQGVISPDEAPAVKKVLRAAAMTYVVAALSSILQLAKFLLLARGRDRN